uniref:Potassium channel domain-containing protein n=2 Tax=Parascaris TaxID=6254 RepID=A0A915C8D8_PARUN
GVERMVINVEPNESDAFLRGAQNGDVRKSLIRINVGGRSARLEGDLLRSRYEDGRLAHFSSLSHNERLMMCDAYFDSSQEYYFERSPIIFECIIDFYITGRLHRPLDVCPVRVLCELDFWRIPTQFLSRCCKINNDSILLKKTDSTLSTSEQIYLEMSCPPSAFDEVFMGKQRLLMWKVFENPRSSTCAKCLSLVSALFVLLSLSDLILCSIPELQDENQDPHWSLIYLEISCMVWFTVEYIIRFIISPQKCSFVKSPLNVIDLMTILPFYAEECLPLVGIVKAVELRNIRGAMVVIRVMRLARVARIFKLARYSTGLRAFGETMRKSAAELSMLGMFLLTGIMLFSTAIYFFERDEQNSKFYSIPAACWWCIITMTTVGYGDLVPVTAGGKVVAALASVCGIIVLAFPISMIIDKFAESTAIWSTETNDQLSTDERQRSRRKARRHLF